jgi:hypothetical protein
MLGTSETGPQLRVVGLIGWAVLLGLCLAWEGLGLVYGHDHWPSMSDLLRTVSRPVAGRWILLALWIWLGWHLFVRGWQPLLRGEQAPQHPGITMSLTQIAREVLTPLLATYALVLGMIALTARRARREAALRPKTVPSAESVGALRQAGRIVTLLLVGYAAFFGIILTYYAVVANESPAFLVAAARGGAFITFAVALPGLLLLSAVGAIAGRRPRHSPA